MSRSIAKDSKAGYVREAGWRLLWTILLPFKWSCPTRIKPLPPLPDSAKKSVNLIASILALAAGIGMAAAAVINVTHSTTSVALPTLATSTTTEMKEPVKKLPLFTTVLAAASLYGEEVIMTFPQGPVPANTSAGNVTTNFGKDVVHEVELVVLTIKVDANDLTALARWSELAAEGYEIDKIVTSADRIFLFMQRDVTSDNQKISLPAAVEGNTSLAKSVRAKISKWNENHPRSFLTIQMTSPQHPGGGGDGTGQPSPDRDQPSTLPPDKAPSKNTDPGASPNTGF